MSWKIGECGEEVVLAMIADVDRRRIGEFIASLEETAD